MPREALPYVVELCHSEAQLRAACRVREASYGHHLATVSSIWSEPDALDRDIDTAVFVAIRKTDAEPIGTVRLTTNARRATQVERAAAVPDSIREGLMAEVTRLAIVPDNEDPTVRLSLVKVSYLYALAHQVQWLVIGARSEGLVRQYRRLGFTDIGDGKKVAFPHAGNMEHWILAFDVMCAERNWHALRHPFYNYMARTFHPDLHIAPRAMTEAEPLAYRA
mgnify:CR=1 FL=1